ncbi:hypothetical protein [Caulobacter soli]|uniref:hypothetical protein n=1 Tax=Caulobacter soli TaxID=2708539 RepID=UPI0013ECCB73|nr:hypothetical protein [Caulobacter soli]
MSSPVFHHPADQLFWLVLALFVSGSLAFSLWSGKVAVRYGGPIQRSTSPALFWGLCILKLAFATISAVVFVLSLGRK